MNTQIKTGMSKALKAQSKADIDIWESRYVCSGLRMKKDAKRSYNRAQRRLDKVLTTESANG